MQTAREESMTFIKDPILTMRGAMDLLADVQARSDTIEIVETLSAMEEVLFSALLKFVRNAERYGIPKPAPTGAAVH
jgi:hypothetical protein